LLLKSTSSLCPVCLSSIESEIIYDDGLVLLNRCCPKHGRNIGLIERDLSVYEAGFDFSHPVVSPKNILIPITHRCNLSCDNCYTQARSDELTVEKFNDLCEKLRPQYQALIISGGEPTIHPKFDEILDSAVRYFSNVFVNTNGLQIPDCHRTFFVVAYYGDDEKIRKWAKTNHYISVGLAVDRDSIDLIRKAVAICKELGISNLRLRSKNDYGASSNFTQLTVSEMKHEVDSVLGFKPVSENTNPGNNTGHYTFFYDDFSVSYFMWWNKFNYFTDVNAHIDHLMSNGEIWNFGKAIVFPDMC